MHYLKIGFHKKVFKGNITRFLEGVQMSLEELEELEEAEPMVEEERRGFKASSFILGYLLGIIVFTLIIIKNQPELFGSILDYPSILILAIEKFPVQGSIFLDLLLGGNYIQAILLIIPAIIAGLAGGLICGRSDYGATAGGLVWIVGFLLGLLFHTILVTGTIIISDLGTFLELLMGYIDMSKFIDPIILIVFGAIGGGIRR